MKEIELIKTILFFITGLSFGVTLSWSYNGYKRDSGAIWGAYFLIILSVGIIILKW